MGVDRHSSGIAFANRIEPARHLACSEELLAPTASDESLSAILGAHPHDHVGERKGVFGTCTHTRLPRTAIPGEEGDEPHGDDDRHESGDRPEPDGYLQQCERRQGDPEQ